MNSNHQNAFKNFAGNAAENYEKYFVSGIGGPLAKELVDIALLQQGERVLDVACGTGIVARLSADRVGSGHIAAVDMNPAMLAIAKKIAAHQTIDWHEASAEKLPFPDDSFDVVLSQLGLQFFHDRVAALREMHRVVRSGGRVFVRTAGPTPELFTILEEALSRHISKTAGGFVQHIFSLHNVEEIRGIFSEAGFQQVSIRQEIKTIQLPEPQEFLWQYVSGTPLAAPLSEVDDATRSALQQELVTKWEPFVRNGRMHLNLPDVLTTALKS